MWGRGRKKLSPVITICRHSASLVHVMPIGDPWDGFFYPTLNFWGSLIMSPRRQYVSSTSASSIEYLTWMLMCYWIYWTNWGKEINASIDEYFVAFSQQLYRSTHIRLINVHWRPRICTANFAFRAHFQWVVCTCYLKCVENANQLASTQGKIINIHMRWEALVR